MSQEDFIEQLEAIQNFNCLSKEALESLKNECLLFLSRGEKIDDRIIHFLGVITKEYETK